MKDLALDKLALTKFIDKRELRLLLRHNRQVQVKCSSIYKLGDMYYVLLQSATELAFPTNSKVTLVISLSKAEEYIFNWARSEILQEVNFVRFEHKTELND